MLSCSVVSDSWRPHGLQPTRLLCPWDSPGKNTGVGCHVLLQGCIYLLPIYSQVALVVKDWTANAGDIGDTGSVPGSGRSAEGGNGKPCGESHGQRRLVGYSWTRLK